MELRLAQLPDLPTLPVIVLKIVELMNKPEISILEIAKLVSADQVITSKIIKVVNSPFYALRQEITNLQHALTYLGLDKVKSLVLTCSLITHLEGKGGGFNMKTFWEHSFGCGIVCRIIAEKIKAGPVENVYLAGLVHDLGEIAISTGFKAEFPAILRLVQTEGYSFHAAEQAVLGYTHCEVGGWLARRWRFPEDLVDTMEHHHDPTSATTAPTTVAIVNLADLFCRVRSLGYGFFENLDVSFEEEPGWKMLKANHPSLDGMDLERFTYELDEKMEEVLALIASVY